MKNDGVRIYFPVSNIYLIQSRKKNHAIYLFTAIATLLIFIPVLLPGVSNHQSFPTFPSAPWGSVGSSFSTPFSALKTWEITSFNIVSWKLPNAIQSEVWQAEARNAF